MIKSFSRREILFVVLGGIFVTNAILGELIGGKLIQLGPFAMSIGVIPWPVVFITTDLINEYFGKSGVRRLTFLTVFLIIYAFVLLYLAIRVPTADFSPVKDEQFRAVFGQSLWIIVGSLMAFMASQLVDVVIFWIFRVKTRGRMLWLRATGSTAVSQFIDSFIIIAIAFWLPEKVSLWEFLTVAITNYSYKFLIAVLLTPLIYLGHDVIDRFLGGEEAHRLIEKAMEESV
jgi:queuosine precursor transporter